MAFVKYSTSPLNFLKKDSDLKSKWIETAASDVEVKDEDKIDDSLSTTDNDNQ